MAKRNKQLAEFFRGLPCVICYQPGELDHILNFKRLAHRDQKWNCWSVCRRHHHEKTHYGLTRFAKMYDLENELINMGFSFDGFLQRWIHKNDK